MSDTTDTPTVPLNPETAPEVPAERTVPYERFQQVNQQAKEAKQQLEDLRGRLEELETRDQSEVERERAKREQYESRSRELEQRLTVMERSSWLRSAAADAGFDDPEDAVAFINPSSVESEDEAERAVKKLAKRKPKLLRDTSPAPQIGQVLANGQRVDPNAPQRDQDAEAFMAQIRAAQDEDGWQSIPIQ
jgi:DNA repair exonuclease SbcCD ATPase subunit